jgi:hypothetical protein
MINNLDDLTLNRKLKVDRVEVCLNCTKFVDCEDLGKFEICEDFEEMEGMCWVVKKYVC